MNVRSWLACLSVALVESAAVVVLLSAGLASAQVGSRLAVEKSVIRYLGTNFILHDGCPAPRCDRANAECARTISMVRNLYAHCVQSEEGQYVGCIRERLTAKEYITLPKYASKCSAMCYESDPVELARIVRCPYQGYRQHDPRLQGLFK